MSKWYDAIDIDVNNDEVNILIDQDSDGNVYVSAKIDDILKAIDESRNQETIDPLEQFS